MIFSTASTHIGNSLVLFNPEGDRNLSLVPASIQGIVDRGREVTISVRRQALATNSSTPDPFTRYPYFPAKLYSLNLEKDVEDIPLEWVQCHFARFKWSDELAVVLSLSRVRSSPSIPRFSSDSL